MLKDILLKYKLYAILTVLLGLLIWAGIRAWKIGDSYSKLEGEYKVLKKITVTEHEKHLKEIAEINIEKIKLDEEIKKTKEKIKVKDENIKNLGKKISSLENEYVTTGDNKDKQIENLKAQVSTWSERFSLLESEIEDKDKIIFDLTQKYELQAKETLKWKTDYEKQVELQVNLEDSIASLKTKLRVVNFKSNLKTYLIVGIAGYVSYQMIKEK